jgi:hypothetical protein
MHGWSRRAPGEGGLDSRKDWEPQASRNLEVRNDPAIAATTTTTDSSAVGQVVRRRNRDALTGVVASATGGEQPAPCPRAGQITDPIPGSRFSELGALKGRPNPWEDVPRHVWSTPARRVTGPMTRLDP